MNVVGIGGGHGLSVALHALRLLGEAPTAVVTVADDGGSSGRLRQEHGVVALGDMRRALVTLADEGEVAELFEHRFEQGELQGHSLGNLLLLGLLELSGGGVVPALDRAAELLGCAGRVLPCTEEPVQLRACVGGREVGGQVRVATAEEPVERVWLAPHDPKPCEAAVAAIENAEVIVLGPGSLYTSIIATLLVPGIASAVAGGNARVVLVGNLLTQLGETSRMTAQQHVDALLAHVPGLRLDVVLLHDGPAPTTGGTPLGTQVRHRAVGEVVLGDLAQRTPDGDPTPVHDPRRLADVLETVLRP